MSVLRQQNWLGQQRVDVPHLRAVESSIAADFDVLAGRVMAGEAAVVVRGFTLTNITASTSASAIQLSTADSILLNLNATEAGTFLWVPADRAAETLNSAVNARVDGSFTASQTNYIGLDLVRTADDSTSDLVQFLDANTLLESARSVPLARTLDYRIVISTTPFSSTPNLIPIAKVVTNSQNQVDSAVNAVEDARNMMYRLAQGGDFPNRYSSFTWPQDRIEQDPSISALQSLDRFSGGDKGIRSQKDWMDAVMTRIWEIGGGQFWYSSTADRNLKLVGAPSPAVFSSTSDNFEWGIEAGVPATGLYGVNHIHWQGLRILFENSNIAGVYYNTVVDQLSDDPGTPATASGSKTALDVGDCIYVDLDRTSNATVIAKKASLQSLGSPSTPGSRVILAWRTSEGVFRRDSQLPINSSYPAATVGANGSVRLAYAAGTPANPTVLPLNGVNQVEIGGGAYPISGNNFGLIVTGGGTGAGASFTGGATNGNGLNAFGVGLGVGAYITSAGGDGCSISAGGNGRAIVAVGSGSGAGASITGGSTAGSHAALFTGGGAAGNGIRSTATGTGLAGEFIATSSTYDALKVTTGIFRARQLEDTAAGNMLIGTDNTKTAVVNIGNTANGVNIYGATYINGNTQARGNVTIPDAFPGDVKIPSGNNYGFNSVRTFKKTFLGLGMTVWAANGTFAILREGPSVNTARAGKGTTASGTDQVGIAHQFGLPVGAIITAVTLKLSHAGSASTAASVWLKKFRPAASGSEFTISDCLTSSGVTLGAGATLGVDVALPLSGTPANLTVSQADEVFAFEYTAVGTGYNYVVDLVVTYTLPNILPDNA